MTSPLVVIGDALLDRDIEGRAERLCPDAPVPVLDAVSEHARAGGAALAACLAATDGVPVTLVTALADDAAGDELRSLIEACGVDLVDTGLDGATPEKIRMRAADQSLLRLDRGCERGSVGPLTAAAETAIARGGAVVVSDYGRGVADEPTVRAAVGTTSAPVVWDPHPRGPSPVAGARVVTPNRAELLSWFGTGAGDLAAVTVAARRARTSWAAHGVVVTLGGDGALLVAGDGPPLAVPVPHVHGGDTCGAGDRFATAVAHALARGALPSEAVVEAVQIACDFVAAGAASALTLGSLWPGRRSATSRPQRTAEELVARVRGSGGTVVATGGCFDLLHAGHVSLLRAARALGDCLVVCLNSDASVRRLKGDTRPVNAEADRAAVLLALDSVDAIAIFDDDTPVPLLERLRPDVFVKGGDYSGAQLPEAEVLSRWGGQAVVVPYLGGHSTTNLLRHAAHASPA